LKLHPFLDTNVLLDYFLARPPHANSCALILNQAALGKIHASTSATSFTNVAYILGRLEKRRVVEKDILELLQYVKIIPNTAQMLGDAVEMPLHDYEDAVQYVSALGAKCTQIITSNKRDFKNSSIPVLDPSEFCKRYCTQPA
jgi:predicted nucleic acid-binding protein